MKSHHYELHLRELARILLPILVIPALFSLFMHGGAALNWWPSPLPIVDVDRTILLHQAQSSQSQRQAEILLLGDSSCLIDVHAPTLQRLLQPERPVLNLGTLSYIDLRSHAQLLQNFQNANPNQLRAVILLMHPEALRRPAPVEFHVQALQNFLQAEDHPADATSLLGRFLGEHIFKGRFLAPSIPAPLGGLHGQHFGFTHDLWRDLSANQGSSIDPRQFDPANIEGNPEFRLSKNLQETSRFFKTILPPEAKLFVGITPIPQSFAPPNYESQWRQLLTDWSAWLDPDHALDSLPPTLPDAWFASTTHLTPEGAKQYTQILAQLVQGRIGSQIALQPQKQFAN